MSRVTISGIEKLASKLKSNCDLNDVKTVVKKNGAQLQQKAMQKCPVDTGTLKRSIGLEIEDAGLTAVVAPTAHYAPYVEWGTRKMRAQPFIRPSLDEQKKIFENELDKLME
jgi:HK97 gp10 family phage protein